MIGHNMQRGDIEATVPAGSIPDGTAMYWDAAGTLQPCGVDEEYRFAGFAYIPVGGPAGGGDTIYLYPTLDAWAVGDGINAYARGDKVQIGALGVVVADVPRKVFPYTAVAGDEAADTVPIPANAGNVLLVRNQTQNKDFVLHDEDHGAPAVTLNCTLDYTNGLLLFDTVGSLDVVNADVFVIHYVPVKTAIAEVLDDANIGDPVHVRQL